VVAVLDRPAVVGVQSPRVQWVPPLADVETPLAREAFDLCASAGLELDVWQRYVLACSLVQGEDLKWLAWEVGVNVARQNGKDGIIEARELAGLFLVPTDRLQIHSTHQFDTSLEAFRRIEWRIQETPELHARVKPKGYKHSHGEEGIELRDGKRLRFRTRTKGGGRGFSCDCLYLNEAFEISTWAHGALLPTLSARPNPQVWYTGSAVDQQIHDHGYVFAKVRERGLHGGDPALAYFEWSADFGSPQEVEESDAQDEALWALANPGLGIRISSEHIEAEQRSMDNRTFAVERLGVGDWPMTDASLDSVIPLELWDELADVTSRVLDPVCFAFDVSPDRSSASIAACGARGDGLAHTEIVEHRRGTGWVASRLLELDARHDVSAFVCDAASPAGALLPELEKAGVAVMTVNATEYAQACGMLYDAAEQRTFRHLGTAEVRAAVKGAAKRPLGDAWAWSRKNSGVDITPLVAVTLAHFGNATAPSSYMFTDEAVA
jgi:hypothetical protein